MIRFDTRDIINEDISGANSRLVAAAPDLLAACRSAKAWLEYCDMADTAQHARLTDAITKATGQ